MTLERITDEVRLPYDAEAILSGSPVRLNDYMLDLIKVLQDIQERLIELANFLVDLTDGDAVYFGSKDQNGQYLDGSWRFLKTEGNISLQKRVDGGWIEYYNFSPEEFKFSGKITDMTSDFQIIAGVITGAANTNWDAAYDLVTAGYEAWNAAYNHIDETGESHQYINQDVTANAAPVLDNTNMTGNISVWTNDAGYSLDTHRHNGETLQNDAINSDGGAFPFDTTGQVNFNQNVGTVKTVIAKRLLVGGVQE